MTRTQLLQIERLQRKFGLTGAVAVALALMIYGEGRQ